MFNIVKKAVLGLTVFCLMAGVAFAVEPIVIKGSTTVLPIAQAALEAYMKKNPGVQISLSGGGSGEGIKALIDKTTDIADSSREIKKEEITAGGNQRRKAGCSCCGLRRDHSCCSSQKQSDKFIH